MGYDNRKIYILWWENGVSDTWYVVGTYTSSYEVTSAAYDYSQHTNGDGTLWIDYIDLEETSYRFV